MAEGRRRSAPRFLPLEGRSELFAERLGDDRAGAKLIGMHGHVGARVDQGDHVLDAVLLGTYGLVGKEHPLGTGGDLLEGVGDGRGVVYGEVEPVGFFPSGQGGVGVLAAHGRVAEDVGVLGGEALGAADGAGVADLDVLGDVAGGQLDHGAVFGVRDAEGAVVPDHDDGIQTTVLDPGPGALNA